MIEHRPRPRGAHGVSRLARKFAGLRRTVERVSGRLPIEVVENSSLESQGLLVGKIEAMLDANLRRPSPEISGIGEGWNSERSERCGRKRRDEKRILSGDYGGLFPIEAKAGGLKAHNAKV